jgi:hypothetical protein
MTKRTDPHDWEPRIAYLTLISEARILRHVQINFCRRCHLWTELKPEHLWELPACKEPDAQTPVAAKGTDTGES